MNKSFRLALVLRVAGGGFVAGLAAPAFVRRRLLAAALALPWIATAGITRQTASRPMRIAVFIGGVLPGEGFNSLPWHRRRTTAAFAKAGLRDGGNVTIQYVAIDEAPAARIEAAAREVVALRPDVIFAIGSEVARLFQGLTRDIPVVFAFSPDPLREGLVQSYRRPGGNLTGTSSRWYELLGKRLELVKEIRPDAHRVALLMGEGELATHAREQLSSDASRLGLTLVDLVMPKGEVGESESPRLAEGERQAIGIIVRILKGESPATIPVFQATRYHVALNRGTARAMGLEVSQSVMLRVDEVVE